MTVGRLSAFMVGVVLLGGFVASEAQARELELRVLADLTTFDTTAPAALGGAAFYVTGDICEDTTPGGACVMPIGEFHCWGWLVGPDQVVAIVSQEYHIFGRGKIQTQGLEDEGPRAVVGGTGYFRNVRGEATGTDFSNFPPEFNITFKLKGAKK